MAEPGSHLPHFIQKRPVLSKVLVATALTLLFASIHFLLRYGWTQATGRQFFSKDIALIYSGYLLLPALSTLIFIFHKRLPNKKNGIGRSLTFQSLAALAFSALHSLLFSLLYYALNPAWQEYSFWLLFKDIAFNYYNTGLAFYLGAILLSILVDDLLGRSNAGPSDNLLRVKDQRKTYLFPLNEIAYFTSADNYVKVHCGNQSVLMRESMSSLEKRLDPNTFLRVHRTALINRHFVSQIVRSQGQAKLVMTDNAEIPISRRRKDALNLLERI